MHTTYGMCGVFSYLLFRSQGHMYSRGLECTFLAKFRVDLNMLYIPYVVVGVNKLWIL